MANNVIEMKPSRIGMTRIGERTILTPKESLTHLNSERLEKVLQQCIEQRKKEIVLDCKNIPFMDSEGLQLLLKMQDELKNRGSLLKIIGLTPVCRDIFMATRLTNLLYVYEDIHEAIKDRA